MRPRPFLARLAPLAAGLLVAGAAEAQLFKCVQPGGKVVYQDSPCGEAARQSTLRAPAPGPVPAAPADPAKDDATERPPAAAPGSSATDVIALVAGYSNCAERVPNFAFKYAAAYEGWKTRNALGFARLGSEPDASRLDERMRAERERPQGPSLADHCAGVATALQPPRTSPN